MDLYVNVYLYCQNNMTNVFLDPKLVEEVLVEIFGRIVQYIFLICDVWRPFKNKMIVAELCPADQMSRLAS